MIVSYASDETLRSTQGFMSLPVGVCVLGSTGSIGTQTLDVIRRNSDFFSVTALSAHSNKDLLLEQIREFKPETVVVTKNEDAEVLNTICKNEGLHTKVMAGAESLSDLVSQNSVDIVLNAILGFAALPPLLAAIKHGKSVAIANKESLVAAGDLVHKALSERPVMLVPVDSEHNAIYQAMKSRPGEKPVKIILTASGGPFFRYPLEDLSKVTPEQAAKHPRWNMGMKISIDSASLMNKGLEVMEAAVLFGLPEHEIEVLIHPQSIVHGFVEYRDGSTVAVCYEPDMKIPILNALTECAKNSALLAKAHTLLDPAETESAIGSLNRNQKNAAGSSWLLTEEERTLEFFPVNNDKFPSISLVRNALRAGGSAPLVLNAANEVAVSLFIEKKIAFTDIMTIVRKVLEESSFVAVTSYGQVLELDQAARDKTVKIYSEMF